MSNAVWRRNGLGRQAAKADARKVELIEVP